MLVHLLYTGLVPVDGDWGEEISLSAHDMWGATWVGGLPISI